jgi:hypothetical protein
MPIDTASQGRFHRSVKRILLVTLLPTPDDHAALLRTLEAPHTAWNAIAAVAFAHHVANKFDVQQLVRYDLRQHCGVSAQMTVRASAKTAKAYRRGRAIRPSFRRHGAMSDDERICRFPTVDRVSLLTLDERVVVPLRFGVYAAGMLQRRRGQGDVLWRARTNTFFLAVTMHTSAPAPDEVSDYLGVDLGVIALEATSDGEFLNHATGAKHAHTNAVRARCSRFREQLHKTGDEVDEAAAQDAQRA